MLKRILLSTLVVALICVVGCKKGPEKPANLPDLTACELTFTVGGAPCDGALVMLVGNGEWKPSGVTDKNGTVKLMTYGRYEGVPAGAYTVTIEKTEPVNPNDGPMEAANIPPAELASSVVPAKKYASPDSSDLKIEVAAKTPVVQTFEIE